MVDKFYNGLIEQVYNQVGKVEKNIAMACYNNDFSIENLESIKRYSENQDNVFFAWHEFPYGKLSSSYAPFWDIICHMYQKHINGKFEQFLEECNVYQLQRDVLRWYYYEGVCVRNEEILLNEVEYERKRMVRSFASMILRLAEFQPIVIVINRLQIASRSTLDLVLYLLKHPTNRIGIVLGANESQRRNEYISSSWEEITKRLLNDNRSYHIGSTGVFMKDVVSEEEFEKVNFDDLYRRINNNMELMDYEQVNDFLQKQYRRFSEELFQNSQENYLRFLSVYLRSAILCGDLSKGLELVATTLRCNLSGRAQNELNYHSAYHAGVCYMYQGKLEEAERQTQKAREEAEILEDEFLIFKADMLMVQNKMSGWNNIFFIANDVPIEESLLKKMLRYKYMNHMAHVFIYAYDNNPALVAQSGESEKGIVHFSKGVAMAKELDNELLIYNAYQKNIMIASTNGMNEIALLYATRMYQSTKVKHSLRTVRVYTALGYNINAMGYSGMSEQYYFKAIELLYDLRNIEDIAEVYYNLGLNYLMAESYEKASDALEHTLKIIVSLHLNSLRVCNLSKLYALLAITAILRGQHFDCERYLKSCSQFLNYVIAKDSEMDDEIMHDYKMVDDDLFLFHFSKGRQQQLLGNLEKTFEEYEIAEKHLMRAEGNQFFVNKQFREFRIQLFRDMGNEEQQIKEQKRLQKYLDKLEAAANKVSLDMVKEIECGEVGSPCRIQERELEILLLQTGLEVDYRTNQKHLEYLEDWQNQIARLMHDQQKLVSTSIWNFLNTFGTDGVVYLRFNEDSNEVVYNTTEIYFDDNKFETVRREIKNYPEGFAVSKIRENFYEHLDLISYFGVDDICSFVAVPCYENEKLQAVVITFVQMKDNWHSVVNRYMLDDSDLKIYKLMFRELNNSVNQIRAKNKIEEMNQRLEQSAVTDMLTGLYNRAGMYREIEEFEKGDYPCDGVGIMFIDLDNFKPYNDTFGHDIGDIVLQGMADIFKTAVGNKGVVCRYGGDEFIILLTTGDKAELESYAQSIFHLIKSKCGFVDIIREKMGKDIEINEGSCIGCSMGIAMSGLGEKHSINELIARADDVMYEVKMKSKGTYAFI